MISTLPIQEKPRKNHSFGTQGIFAFNILFKGRRSNVAVCFL